MTEKFDKLRNTVLAEVRRQHHKKPHQNHMRVLGSFLTANLNRRRRTPRDMARELGVPTAVVEMLLRGELPEWMLSDSFVVKLGKVTRCEPNVLRVMMGRAITNPAIDDSAASG